MSGTVFSVKKYLDLNGVGYTEEQAGILADYTDMLLEAGRTVNLTAVKTADEAVTRLRAPLTSTTQMRQAPISLISLR